MTDLSNLHILNCWSFIIPALYPKRRPLRLASIMQNYQLSFTEHAKLQNVFQRTLWRKQRGRVAVSSSCLQQISLPGFILLIFKLLVTILISLEAGFFFACCMEQCVRSEFSCFFFNPGFLCLEKDIKSSIILLNFPLSVIYVHMTTRKYFVLITSKIHPNYRVQNLLQNAEPATYFLAEMQL